ncbi:MAG: hypothetical protein LUE29_10900 [Lachnospiraceae bacterium]|nr:hypothetical protein [Lachnospiraceae bacterium]
MNEDEILRRLKIAYESFTKSNISEYQTAMREAKALIDTLPERGALYGEWLLLTYLPNMWNLDKICEIFREALGYIQGYSRVIPRRAQLFGDSCSPLASLNQTPGHADENGAKLHEAVELYFRLTGGGRTTDACYRAQLAQDRGDFETARQEALTVFAEARHQGQEMNALNAAELLAQQGKHLQDEKLWNYFFSYIQKVADGTTPAEPATRQQAEIISAMLLLSLGLMAKLPDWVEGCEHYAIGLPEGGVSGGGRPHRAGCVYQCSDPGGRVLLLPAGTGEGAEHCGHDRESLRRAQRHLIHVPELLSGGLLPAAAHGKTRGGCAGKRAAVGRAGRAVASGRGI